MEILEQGFYYHIYNRGINSCQLFEETSITNTFYNYMKNTLSQ